MSVPSHKASVAHLVEQLRTLYPDAKYELNWETPFQLLVATILAAQCTDERVNRVTATLFPRYPGPAEFVAAPLEELEEAVKPTGVFRQKAKTVQAVSRALLDRFGGEVPPRMEDLVSLPGVARKTANVVLTTAFRIPAGIIVDTHVKRVSQRMGLTESDDPEEIEQELMQKLPRDTWCFFGPAMVLHGRYTCTARKPDCEHCALRPGCAEKI
jgi:endonuclease-3